MSVKSLSSKPKGPLKSLSVEKERFFLLNVYGAVSGMFLLRQLEKELKGTQFVASQSNLELQRLGVLFNHGAYLF